MKVLHFGTLDYNAGGPAMSTYLTLKGLKNKGIDVNLLMYPLSPNGVLRGEDVSFKICKSPLEHKFAFSFNLKSEIKSIPKVDIYHAQGIWQYPTYAICDVARKMHKPYLITPRGMLYPQDIAKSSTFFKKLSLNWRLLKDLNKAACVHVTCHDEMHYCRKLGITSPIAVIPNPIEIKEYPPHNKSNIFTLGYIGRISRRKNIESLIYAFNSLNLNCDNAKLIIIGGGDFDYESFLKDEVKRLKLDNVEFTGFLSGIAKDEVLSRIDVLAMPSEFENLGNVILEGLVRGIPCIATKGSPWQDLVDYNCGWWVDYSQDAITEAIRQAMFTEANQMIKMGENGKKLMEDKYSVDFIGNQMKELYEWILYYRSQPNFVFK